MGEAPSSQGSQEEVDPKCGEPQPAGGRATNERECARTRKGLIPTQGIFSPADRGARRGAAEVKKAWQTSGSGTATASLPCAAAAGAGVLGARSPCRTPDIGTQAAANRPGHRRRCPRVYATLVRDERRPLCLESWNVGNSADNSVKRHSPSSVGPAGPGPMARTPGSVPGAGSWHG